MKPMSHMFIALVTVGVFLLSGLAIAQDRKIHSGNMCQPEYHSYATDLQALPNGSRNGSTTATIHVTCPIVRDNVLNVNGTIQAFVNVQSSGGLNLSCYLGSYDPTGAFIASTSASTVSNVPIGLNVDVGASAVLGSYALHCILPPLARIFNYDISEF
jgi:hypothetical protein